MFTFVISLVVVGAALFIATRIAIGAAPKPGKPATPVARGAGGRQFAPKEEAAAERVVPAGKIPALRRVRSGLLLVVLLTILGTLAAFVILIVGALVLNGLRSAVQ